MAATGLKKETAGALASLLGPSIIIPVILFFVEKDTFVRFYAIQAVLTFIAALTLTQVLFLLSPVVGFIWIGWFIIWLIMTYKAWQGVEWEVPLLGKFSRQILSKIK